jgi:hypothetical protein
MAFIETHHAFVSFMVADGRELLESLTWHRAVKRLPPLLGSYGARRSRPTTAMTHDDRKPLRGLTVTGATTAAWNRSDYIRLRP